MQLLRHLWSEKRSSFEAKSPVTNSICNPEQNDTAAETFGTGLSMEHGVPCNELSQTRFFHVKRFSIFSPSRNTLRFLFIFSNDASVYCYRILYWILCSRIRTFLET